MARRRHLVAYDIRDERRLRSVAGCMERYGDRIQYSVFVCDLSDRELVLLRTDIEGIIRSSVDSVMIIDLGPIDATSRFTFIGRHEDLPDGGAVIV
jgi:CRISPR-associated protein Cas2